MPALARRRCVSQRNRSLPGGTGEAMWRGKRILVTGGRGFLGTHIVDRLIETRGVDRANVSTPSSSRHDLRDRAACVEAMTGCDIVLHLAADAGGLGYTREHPATQYANCTLIDVNVYQAAAALGIERLLAVSSVIGYPANASVPFVETEFYGDLPAASHLGYGVAKRNLALLAGMFGREHGLSASTVIASNA